MGKITAEELQDLIQYTDKAMAASVSSRAKAMWAREIELYKLALLGLQSGRDAERFQYIEDWFVKKHSLKMDNTSDISIMYQRLGRYQSFREAIDAHKAGDRWTQPDAAISSQAEGVKDGN